MDLLPMFLAFIVACVVLFVCLTKKQMKIARTFFLGFGIVIGTCSLFLIYADWQFSQLIDLRDLTGEINTLTTMLLGISTLIFCAAILVIAVATIVLSVIAIKKIAEYIKSKKRTVVSAPSENQKPIAEPIFSCARKIFVLHCRWNN